MIRTPATKAALVELAQLLARPLLAVAWPVIFAALILRGCGVL